MAALVEWEINMAQQDIVGNLFGVTPQIYEQSQADKARQQALQYAQLDPQQQSQFALYSAGQNIPKAVGGLLGIEDPQMQLVSRTNQLVQQIGVDTPEKLRTLAGELQKLPGGASLATQAIERANKMLESQATVTAKTREQLPTIAKLQSYRQSLVAQLGPNDPRVKEVDAIIRAEGEGKGTKIVMPAGETEVSKVVGKGVGDKILSTAAAGEAGADNLTKIDETLNELRTNKAFTGSFVEIQTNLAKIQAKFAGDTKAGKQVTDTEYLDALLGSDVFPMINSLGIGAKGLDTPAEREFLRKVMTGTVSLERDTLIKLTETRRNIAERAVKKYNKAVENGELNEYFRLKGIKPTTINIPKTVVDPGADYDKYVDYIKNQGKTPKTREQYIQDKTNLKG
jgi:hypothetical protein